jgi:hypothetical protein
MRTFETLSMSHRYFRIGVERDSMWKRDDRIDWIITSGELFKWERQNVAQHTLIHPVRCKKKYIQMTVIKHVAGKIFTRDVLMAFLCCKVYKIWKNTKKKKSGLNFALDNCNTPISNFISVREPDTWFEWKMGNKDNWKNTKSLSRF